MRAARGQGRPIRRAPSGLLLARARHRHGPGGGGGAVTWGRGELGGARRAGRTLAGARAGPIDQAAQFGLAARAPAKSVSGPRPPASVCLGADFQ